MKFARELEQDLVPEWRAKYLDYKLGKKKIKAIAKALRNVNGTPTIPGRQRPTNLLSTTAFQAPIRNRTTSDTVQIITQNLGPTPISTPVTTPGIDGRDPRQTEYDHSSPGDRTRPEYSATTSPIPIKDTTAIQGSARDSSTAWDSAAITSYGSIIPSPPAHNPPFRPPSLELPDPALPPEEEPFARHNRAWRRSHLNPHITPPLRQRANQAAHPYEIGTTHVPPKATSSLLPRHRPLFKNRRAASNPSRPVDSDRPRLLRRIFSSAATDSPQIGDVPLAGYKEFDIRLAEFEKYLDSELHKIESFYKMKEQEAGDRLIVLRRQLHEMRDRRVEEVRHLQQAAERQKREQRQLHEEGRFQRMANAPTRAGKSSISSLDWRHPLNSVIAARQHLGKNTKALVSMESPEHGHRTASGNRQTDQQDFTRRPTYTDDVPYRSAKRKLRMALQEFYRGLELLKSYALLNRTAFRKINKKYDKVVKARPTGRFMSEKVNKAWFVQSEVLEGQLVAIEDLYARYFEHGNHKIAVGKLRSKSSRVGDHEGSIFRNGLFLAAGAVFGIQGLVYGAEHLRDPHPTIRTNASYLLQIYGGYFLALFLVLLFCLDCRVWTKAKINYKFIFEFDPRHNLNWHQLSELPCLLWFLLGFFIWLNFRQSTPNAFYLHLPILLIAISALILFLPAPIIYHRSRAWWAYSNFRLLLAGIYPVEFRDFFLGDMYCSQTYAMGNLELFFCLYAKNWSDPTRCNSTHSRLLGFFTTVPGIWRALQCLRRFYDTRNAFPHLVNCGKYTFTILFYMTLSLYRLDESLPYKAAFIACATVNAVYCSIWDLAMDWSLCNPYAEHPFLREVLGYKNPNVYYAAMILDPVLRFNWVFYAFFSSELQHSALLSFLVGFSEVCRRGIWTLFRVENEHCTNVGRFRASRDVPLPYDFPSPTPSLLEEQRDTFVAVHDGGTSEFSHTAPVASGAQISPELTRRSPGSMRRRGPISTGGTPVQRGIARVGTIMTQAHAQDFERKRRPGGTPLERQATYEGRIGGRAEISQADGVESSSSEDAAQVGGTERDEEGEEEVVQVESIIERRRSAVE